MFMIDCIKYSREGADFASWFILCILEQNRLYASVIYSVSLLRFLFSVMGWLSYAVAALCFLLACLYLLNGRSYFCALYFTLARKTLWLVYVKPVLNWANICFANLVWGIRQTYFVLNCALLLRETSSGYSSNCDEAMFRVQKALPNMFREYSPSLANLASDWLRAKTALLWMRKKQK